MRRTVSVAIVTQGEETHLERTLESIAWADEIVIVDSGWLARTEEIARKFNARFFDETWKGLSVQKNSAIEKCMCDWVLCLNVGETVSERLAEEIRQILHDPSAADGYAFPRSYLFLGRSMRFGGLAREPRLKMFRRGSAEFEPSLMHERLHFVGKVGMIKSRLEQSGPSTLYEYIKHSYIYSRPGPLGAEQERGGSKLGILTLLYHAMLSPIGHFLYNYILRLGFLDGREGALLHMYESVYMSWRCAKHWESSRPPLLRAGKTFSL